MTGIEKSMNSPSFMAGSACPAARWAAARRAGEYGWQALELRARHKHGYVRSTMVSVPPAFGTSGWTAAQPSGFSRCRKV
jgi:hypothetical protein